MGTMYENNMLPRKTTSKIQFSLLGPDEILRQSVTDGGITYPETMEGGKPKIGGVMDPRQGVVERDGSCRTCNGKQDSCPGHFGHIQLSKPVFYGHYLPEVKTILKCVCIWCSKLLIDVKGEKVLEIIKSTPKDLKKRRTLIFDLCKKMKICPSDVEKPDEIEEEKKNNASGLKGGCGRKQPKSIKRVGLDLLPQWKDGQDEGGEIIHKFTAEKVLEIFKEIDDETIVALGLNTKFARPEWMIGTVLPVLPLCVRPSVLAFGTSRCHDDLTHKLADIVKANNLLRDNEASGMASHVIEENLVNLQYHVNTMFDNSMPGVPKSKQKSGRPIKAIKQRIVGKEGRVRGNLMGKRVDFCARSVITPDPLISIDEVGVPRAIAQILTYPEIVTPFNINKLTELVKNGPDHYPGAVGIIKNNGDRVNLRVMTNASYHHLEYGYKVERHLQDGDPVVFNRQPSLHKMSMMCHKARVMPWSTFRLNLSVTKPYNADFDGDEMNLHLPQNLEAKAEIVQLAAVPRMIVTPQSNKPVMGIVQDALTGVYKMTARNEFISKNEFLNLLMHLPSWDGRIPQPAVMKPVPLWSGKQLFSLIIPGKVNCTKNFDENALLNPDDKTVIVINGELIGGILCKKTLGSSEGSLLHVVYLEEGYEKTAAFYTNIQLVVNQWLLIAGHTVSISDVVGDKKLEDEVALLINSQMANINNYTNDFHNNVMKKSHGCTLLETFENKVNEALNKARDNSGIVVQQSLSRYNNFINMVAAGSKGDNNNISQIIACVGQQNVEGKRISFAFGQRTLPHFTRFDRAPEAGGFVSNSYMKGLVASEFYFHAMAGREGIIDTAVKTSETGYIQRRLVKAMESIKVNYDGTVRNQTGQVIQLTYGDDGLAGEWVESQNLVSLEMEDKAFQNRFMFDVESNTLKKHLDKGIVDDLNMETHAVQTFEREYAQLLEDRDELRRIFPSGWDRIVLPCNLQRLITNAQKIFKINDTDYSNLNPLKVVEDVTDLCNKLKIVKGEDRLSIDANNNAILLMSMMLRSTLSSKRIMQEFHLSSEAFDWLVGEVEAKFTQAQVQPGEMVGVLAAQSLGEPATQMTLNTFHHAGISSKNITLGVPRLKEIINLSKNLKCPGLTVYLNDDIAMDADKAYSIVRQLSHATVKDIIGSTQIIYEPDPSKTAIKDDADLVEISNEMRTIDPDKFSPFVLRMKFDESKIVGHAITASIVEQKIREVFKDDVDVVSFDENRVVRIRILNNKEDEEEDGTEEHNTLPDVDLLRQLEDTLNEMTLKGCPAFKNIYLCQSSALTKQIKRINEHGKLQRVDHYYLETEGTALLEILSTNHVNHRTTISNDVLEIFKVLGIEAAKKAIETEMNAVLSFDGSYVNYRHLSLLCDVMTNKGHVMPITRHGINRQDTGPIARASFEETCDIFVEAAAFAQIDPLKGVSEAIMLGQLANMGTGSFDIILDTNMCELAMEDAEFYVSKVMGESRTLSDFVTGATPSYSCATPAWNSGRSPKSGGFSPIDSSNSPSYSPAYSPGYTPGYSPVWCPGGSSATPEYTPSSPKYTPNTPSYGGSSPGYSPTSPGGSASPRYSPTSPGYSPASPSYCPDTPGYNVNSAYTSRTPAYSSTSPAYTPKSPAYTPTSPAYTPTSPAYTPTSPAPSPSSPSYSPSSPAYSPGRTDTSFSPRPSYTPSYSPSSPNYSPNSPSYTPNTPSYSLGSPSYTPGYSPSSPNYSPSSPSYSPSSPSYSPRSPSFTPGYSPSSPSYSPSSPALSPSYTPSSPSYSPTNN